MILENNIKLPTASIRQYDPIGNYQSTTIFIDESQNCSEQQPIRGTRPQGESEFEMQLANTTSCASNAPMDTDCVQAHHDGSPITNRHGDCL